MVQKEDFSDRPLFGCQPCQIMKVLIVSDIHAKWTALRTVLAVEQDYDNILCLGDLVDYGPQPFECVGWAAAKFQEGGWFLQGNHDWSVAYNADARCSKPYAHLAEATRKFTCRVLGHKAVAFLSDIPSRLELSLDGKRCVALSRHATRSAFSLF